MYQKIEPVLGLSNTTNLRTGIDLIDAQHTTLMECLRNLQENLLGDAHLQDAEEDALFLASYSLEHFAEEERLMLDAFYPEYEAHRREHQLFEEWVDMVKARLSEGGDHRVILHEVHAYLSEWLVTHIRDVDMKMARSMQNR